MTVLIHAHLSPFSEEYAKKYIPNHKIRKLTSKLQKKVHKAMIVCNPDIVKPECEILWNEIDDISNKIIAIKTKQQLEEDQDV